MPTRWADACADARAGATRLKMRTALPLLSASNNIPQDFFVLADLVFCGAIDPLRPDRDC